MRSSYFTASFTALMLAACGGSGSSTSSPVAVAPPPPPPQTKTIVAMGPISGFGSIIVNGIKFDTSAASFTVDEASGSQSDLKVGQVVTVKGTLDAQGNAKADSVEFDELVEGPITSIDLDLGEIVVLGQTIFITDDTAYNDSPQKPTIEDLLVGDTIEVSGAFDEDGNIDASLVDPKPGNGIFEVHGFITNLDTAAMTFEFNALIVGYANAGLPEFGQEGPAEGDYASVKGRNFDNGGTLLATRVKKEDENPGEPGDEAEIEGVITDFTSPESFSVGEVPVVTNGSTVFENGSAADLALGVRVEVEGTFNDEGALVADTVKVEIESNIRIWSSVEAVDIDAGTITICGVTFDVSLDTRFDDKSEARLQTFGLADISAGDYVRLRSFRTADDSLVATRIRREDPRDFDRLQDVPTDVGTDSLAILGVTITTDAETEYEDADDNAIAQADFFAAIDDTTYVKAKGTKQEDGSFLANELSFENDDD